MTPRRDFALELTASEIESTVVSFTYWQTQREWRVTAKIRIGPAGWSYEDWKGIVYPRDAESKFDPLCYLAGFFNTIEINSSFYRPPSPKAARNWVERIRANPEFKFTAKLNRRFTHERGQATDADETLFRSGIEPLIEAGKLGAIIIQFPWSFKNDAESREYLGGLLGRFADYPLVVELRHSSWNRPAVYHSLARRDVGFCNIDQPLFNQSIEPSARSTSSVGYVRLHGRNYENWFRETASVADRYDYLYSVEELKPWVESIRQVASQTRETYVITNNHFEGKAVVNALDIMSIMEGGPVPAPSALSEKYGDISGRIKPA